MMPGFINNTLEQQRRVQRLVKETVIQFFKDNPLPVGPKGADGKDASDEQISESVVAYMQAHPVKDGRDGVDGKDGQSIVGPMGPAGKDGQSIIGPSGDRGSLWYSGAGTPVMEARKNDMYLDNATGDVWQMV